MNNMNKLIIELDYILGLHGLKVGYDLHLSEDEILNSFIIKCKDLKDELENKELEIQKLKYIMANYVEKIVECLKNYIQMKY